MLSYVEWGKVGNLDNIKMIHGDAGRASMGARRADIRDKTATVRLI